MEPVALPSARLRACGLAQSHINGLHGVLTTDRIYMHTRIYFLNDSSVVHRAVAFLARDFLYLVALCVGAICAGRFSNIPKKKRAAGAGYCKWPWLARRGGR